MLLGKRIDYSYDTAGNILSVTETDTGTEGSEPVVHTYSYNSTNGWKDQLTGYDGHTITYDGVGNPLTYYNGTDWTFTWTEGRRLATATSADTSVSYEYDSDGYRTSKTVGETTYEYVYLGGKLAKQTWGENTIEFFYDHQDRPYGFLYNGVPYYYILNLQGDVMMIVDDTGYMVGRYQYDAWGNQLEVFSRRQNIADVNPLRYRGYVWDEETGLYYLNSRYYDPGVKRMLSTDDVSVLNVSPSSLNDKNLFSYCDNNPVIRVDAYGNAWETIWDAITLAAGVAELAANPYDPWNWIGVAGDLADVLIPFIGGIGETTRAFKAASKVANTVNDVSDITLTTKKGWKVGEDITNLTKSGNTPSWSTLRSRYWKNKAYYFPDNYNKDNVKRMQKGLAPLVTNNNQSYPKELHHILGRGGSYYFLFFEVSPWEHSIIDPYRYFK